MKFLDIFANAPSTSSTSGSGFIVTASKDSFLKVWDLSTQHCVQTTIAHRSEVWSLDINPEKTLIFTGSSEGEMKVWRIDSEALSEGLKENDSGEVLIRLLALDLASSKFTSTGDEDDSPGHYNTPVLKTSRFSALVSSPPAIPRGSVP